MTKAKKEILHQGENITDFIHMLSYCRPHDSKIEKQFCERYLDPLGCYKDDFGNRIIQIGKSDIAWLSHIDTVHKKGAYQRVHIKDNIVSVPKKSQSNCLGADDTSGIWLMVQMIKKEVPGLYIFHRGEEVGGLGSQHIVDNTPELLDGINAAISLDRMGLNSIITHQMWGRCCSEEFAKDFASRVSKYVDLKSDNTGSFTDSANYTFLVPECTNLSVGYYCQHGRKEIQDLDFLLDIRDALVSGNFKSLTIARDPSDSYQDYMEGYQDYGFGSGHAQGSMVDLVATYPEAVATLLQAYGVSESDILEEALDSGETLGLNSWDMKGY